MRRRGFLKTGTAAAVAAAGVLGATQPVIADHPSHLDDDVNLSFDEDDLKQYRPLLQVGHLDVEPTTIYAWMASSPNKITDAYVYITFYPTQRGIAGSADSHYLDREPCYVFVNSNGNIEEVLYSAYHWLKASTTSPPTYTDSDGQHPAFRVADKWHHYLLDPEMRGEFVGLSELGTDEKIEADQISTQYEEWLDNRWEEELLPGAVVDPWKMRRPEHESWWAKDRREWRRELWLQISSVPFLNIAGADNTDL